MLAEFACTILLLAACQSQPATLEPAWTAPLPKGVDWIEVIPNVAPPVALYATTAPALHLIDLTTGEPQLAEPIPTNTGVQFAGADRDTIYAYDRYAVYAIRRFDPDDAHTHRWRLAWKHDDSTTSKRAERDDPEYLVRITSAAATPAGLLVARSDGLLGMFARGDGERLWKVDVPAASDSPLLVHGDRATLLLHAADAVKVRRFAPGERAPALDAIDLTNWHPLLSADTAAGLVLIEPGRWIRLRPDGAIETHAPPTSNPLSASNTRIVDEPACIWTLGDDRTILCIDAKTGRRLHRHRLPVMPGPWRIAQADATSALVVCDRCIVSTSPAASFAAPAPSGTTIVDARRRPPKVVCLLRGPGGELQIAACATPNEDDHVTTLRPVGRIAPAEDLRDIVWTATHLLLVEKHRIRAYTLPR